MQIINDEEIDVVESAKILGVTPARVRQLILARRLPARKIGRGPNAPNYIKRSDLQLVADRKPGKASKLYGTRSQANAKNIR